MTEKTLKKTGRRRGVNNKNHRVEIRFNDEEFLELESRSNALNCTRADLIRQSILEIEPVKRVEKNDLADLRRLLHQISKIGTNLNQIARYCNLYKNAADSVLIVAYLQEISESIKELKKQDMKEMHHD